MNKADVTLPVSSFGIDLDHHMCGLFSVHGTITFEQDTPSQRRCFLCSDLLDRDSIISHMLTLPVLRELVLNPSPEDSRVTKFYHDFNQVLWLDVKPAMLRNLRLFLRDEQGQQLPVKDCQLHCTLLVFAKNGSSRR